MEASWNIPITDPSQVGEARRIATALASSLLFNETDSGKIALVVTEIGNNISRHANGRGEILLRSVHDGLGSGIEILGVDHGSGMANLRLCMEDGYSTAGTSGIGLGGIRRLSAIFDIDSIPEKGTCILSRIYRGHSTPVQTKPAAFDYGVISVPHPHERVCGDGYFFTQHGPDECTAMVVDGLGHGSLAADAARRACLILQEHGSLPLETLLMTLHSGLKGTRGAAIGIARILSHAQEVRFVGVGNISGSILQPDGTSKSVMSYPGIVGHEMRKAKEMPYPWTDRSVLILHSDGLQTQWDGKAYPRALTADASILAGTLYRDFNRGRDDVTVLAVKPRSHRGFPL